MLKLASKRCFLLKSRFDFDLDEEKDEKDEKDEKAEKEEKEEKKEEAVGALKMHLKIVLTSTNN